MRKALASLRFPKAPYRAFYSSKPVKPKRIVIVGGVAGGATAAARARRLSEDADIVVLEKGPYVSFANCGLPYYIGGEIRDRGKLLLHTPASLNKELNINVQVGKEALKINRERKSISVFDSHSGQTQEVEYDKLILSTGSLPIRPHIPGIGLGKVFELRTITDMDVIHEAASRSKRAVVIGGGFVGLEVVEALVRRGLQVTLVEKLPSVLPQMDYEMTRSLVEEMERAGVTVLTHQEVTSFSRTKTESLLVNLHDSSVEADFAVLSIGVQPQSKLAFDAGLLVNPKTQAIQVNEYMQSSDENIYAVGDVVETPSTWIKGVPHTWTPLAGPANRQARIAADHIFLGGQAEKYRGSLGTSIVRVFDLVAATTGLSERNAREMGISCESTVVNGFSHASYYPEAKPITLKVIWNSEDRKIIGAQAFGFDGVDKRIDIVSTAIMGGMTIDDLGHLELCYSPPFGVARDIVNTAGFLGRNTRLSLTKGANKLEPKYTVIDVRDKLVASNSPIEGALNIPVAELRTSKEIPDKGTIATVCSLGKSSYFASRILQQRGFDAVSLLGGLSIHPELHPHHEQTSVTHSHVSTATSSTTAPKEAYLLDACGIACPGPLMKLRETMPKLEPGQELRVTATDPGFARDFKAFCEAAGMEFVSVTQSKGVLTATLRKPGQVGQQASPTAQNNSENPHDVSIVVFSGDMDKVLAAFIIANGAVAMGGKATMFFTFWGLSALRNNHHASEKKSLVDSMMNVMLPHGINQLGLSHLNIAGIGAQMMRYTMKKKGLPDLNQLVNDSLKNPNVRIVACTMSMTALGIEQSQLVDGIDFGGVAEFLAASSKSKSSLFI